jgi:hypothetical protein
MRWDELFADLEGEFEAARQLELDAEIADQTRAEQAQITLANRLRARIGGRVRLQVAGVGTVQGTLRRVGADFVLVEATGETLVPLDAVTAVGGLPPDAVAEAGVSAVARRLPMRTALRALAADRAYVVVRRCSGESDGGTLSRVGADFVDLLLHDPSEPPRGGAERPTLTVATGGLALVARQSAPW